MAWTVADITRTFKVTDPSGEVASVTIRKMSEGDKQAMGGVVPEDASMPDLLNALRRYRVGRFVTSWTLPIPFTPEALLTLAPEVVDAIDEQVQTFNPGVFPFAQSSTDKATKGEALADMLESYLDESDDSITRDDLASALTSYRGGDVLDPTEPA